MTDSPQATVVGRYVLADEIASGGMASVHLGRLVGPDGFGRIVAIKRLHPQLAKDPDFASMFLDEARLAARIRHPNVASTLDIVRHGDDLLVVLDYVEGDSLSRLARAAQKRGELPPIAVSVAIIIGALQGLRAAHATRDDSGNLLGIVHRDVSPQNILVGIDGIARIVDFGVAKALGRAHSTRSGTIKGKLPYMAPEQVRGETIDQRADIYAASLVLWEMLSGKRRFSGDDEWQVAAKVQGGVGARPSESNPDVPPELDEIVMRGCDLDPEKRYGDALDMAEALEHAVKPASPRSVGAWVEAHASAALAARAAQVARLAGIEAHSPPAAPAPPTPPLESSGLTSVTASSTQRVSVPRASPQTRPLLVGVGAGALLATGLIVLVVAKRLAAPTVPALATVGGTVVSGVRASTPRATPTVAATTQTPPAVAPPKTEPRVRPPRPLPPPKKQDTCRWVTTVDGRGLSKKVYKCD